MRVWLIAGGSCGFAGVAAVCGPSGLSLRVGLPTPRCVVPTRALDGLPADPGVLRVDLGPAGRQGCAGSYAEVARSGRVAVGERLELEAGASSPRAVIRASRLGRIFGSGELRAG